MVSSDKYLLNFFFKFLFCLSSLKTTVFDYNLINLTYTICQFLTNLSLLTLLSSALRTPTTHISNVNLDNMVNASWRNGFRCVASYRLFIHIYMCYICVVIVVIHAIFVAICDLLLMFSVTFGHYAISV